jgi:hypothetical protein
VLRRVALVTCKELPDLDEDTRRLIAPLAARGMAATPAIWDDPEVDWKYFDLVVVRSCWDYVCRRHEFLEWVARVPYLANPAAVLAWNTHKGYLRDLAVRNVPIVPTSWLPPQEEWTPYEFGERELIGNRRATICLQLRARDVRNEISRNEEPGEAKGR